MDLSKNEPQNPPQEPNAFASPDGDSYQQSQEPPVAPYPPQAPQGYLNNPQQPYNQAQGYPAPQFPGQPPQNPYGYQQAPQGYAQQNPGYPPQNPYGQPQYGYAQNPYGYPPAVIPGAKEAKTSWILGLIGIFIFGIILGTIGLVKAFKAKSLGANATAGFVLSSLAIFFHIVWIIFLLASGDTSSY